jgi:hypothetical protein
MNFKVNNNFFTFLNNIKNLNVFHDKYMYLNIFVDDDGDLKKLYLAAAENHNNKILNDPNFYDAGFDLFLPKNNVNPDCYGFGTRFFGKSWEGMKIPVNKVDFKVKCCAKIFDNNNNSFFTPFYTYSRSSLSKTPLRLANNQGIIDAGYRGNLIGMFDCNFEDNSSDDNEQDWYMEEYSRMLQICAPSLVPIYVNIVDNLEDLGPSTSRGIGGFGSTGK